MRHAHLKLQFCDFDDYLHQAYSNQEHCFRRGDNGLLFVLNGALALAASYDAYKTFELAFQTQRITPKK